MVVLEWNNAVKCLALAAPGLYADLLCDLKEGRDCAFQSHGAVIIKTVWYGSENTYGICVILAFAIWLLP